jgi:hypothetical protein
MQGKIDPDETLKEISWAPGYVVSDRGNVYRVVTRDGVPVLLHRKLYLGNVGYYVVTLKGNFEKARPWYIHRLVAEAFLPHPEGNHEVRHLDGDRLNNRVENLAWGTRRENVQDTIRHGRLRRGEDVANAKLSEMDVQVVRYLLGRGASVYAVSLVFRVTDVVIRRIRDGQAWTHLAPLNFEGVPGAENQRDRGQCSGEGILPVQER